MGQTPLHLTLLYGYTGIAKILLSRGANPNVQGIYGHLPLHYACLGFCGNLDGSDGEAVEIVRLLLEQAEKYTCVLGAHTDRRKHKSAAEKQALAIENILEKGLQSVIQPQSIVLKLANPKQILSTISFRGNFLPWHFACGAYVQLSSVLCLDDDMQKWFEANGQVRADILRYLIQEWKIDSSTTASDGLTALHLAVKSDVNGNNLPVIDVLLENCTANVNAVHDHILIDSLPIIPTGVQAIYCSGDDRKQAYVSSRSLDGKYHIILEEGQHVDNVAREQLQVISDLGTKRSHSHHYKYLLPMESRFAALHYALQSNHDTLALRLLSLPDISLDPEGSDLPLLALACAACQSSEVVKRLITQQANMRVHLPLRTSQCDLTAVDADTSTSIANRKNAAALHYAVMYDDSAMVEVLLTSPGDHVHPDVRRSGDGFTPLHLACEMENMKIWHDVEEARVELNILHHQLDRAVRKSSMLPSILPNESGVITIAVSPTSGSPSKKRSEYIMALGTHDAVPLFLRHRGKLKRRVLKKIDVEKVVRKVWVEKRKREQRNPLGRYPLEKVLYEKLHRKYGFQPLIAEWGYNLLLALQLFSWDSEIEMFLLCLTGAVSDLVYVDQEHMIQGCQQLLLRLCELYNVESFVTERRVLLKDALVALRTYFPLKTSAQLQAIEQSIIRDMHKMKRGGNDSILYIHDILPLDVKYPLGFFVKTIRTQHFKEIQDYYALLLSELEQRDTEQRGILPISVVRDAILAIDPLAESGAVQNLIMKALQIKTQVHLHLREPVLYKAVLRKMNATCLMKFALNFDQNAEVNWRRRPGAVYADIATSTSTENKQQKVSATDLNSG
ncbi:hypothetical protein PPTG_22510 [Phytophthora nicotianae INRA-310]|uniref:Uncharacterized protein n=1 Tax=Phytophthora nicotianae (strain INRA-310) TaxID=761204 RepID=W2QHD3_PHYN3|nr:hypothetical protein PPTG_22510 [Phytophthora nicotianae INRA-310]ETN12598.1 hypothetical protein PPTG_22510 [Phytophthora nicotianae INRA-310]